ncbi:MAG: MarR family winged helix-turn-helix transcriptional regulator [Pseudomonadales bacterium]|nr:MarR family winged helix-turn-helix transcriptional regulator [Pseudomonadales bacterium]
MTKRSEIPEGSTLYLLSVINKRIRRRLELQLKSHVDSRLSISHADIVFFTHLNQQATISDLTRHLGVTKSTMTVLLRKLEELKLIQRLTDSKDRRTTWITLTTQAEVLTCQAKGFGEETEEQLLSPLSADDRLTFVRILNALKHHTDAW